MAANRCLLNAVFQNSDNFSHHFIGYCCVVCLLFFVLFVCCCFFGMYVCLFFKLDLGSKAQQNKTFIDNMWSEWIIIL